MTIKVYKENYSHLPERFRKKIDADLEYIVKSNIPSLQKVYLFGSCARNEVRNSSDVDLLILTENKLEDRMLAADIRWTLEEAKCGVKTDIVYMHGDSSCNTSTFNKLVNRDKKLLLEVLK